MTGLFWPELSVTTANHAALLVLLIEVAQPKASQRVSQKGLDARQ